ncbi:serine hydroxymethyltransferase [Candidatus Shapirobacteria bacterium]|nr:serine hydroxymethyltransferase [Candidatus Shapirobacteria bacterium]
MDPIFDLIAREEKQQKELVYLIPSENFISENVKRALGSDLSNKYAEGYPGKRYYQGNKIIDEIENLAIERGKELLGVEHLNVQPYSGSPANTAVLMALLEPGDKFYGMLLSAGGHLTHGHPKVTFSSKFYNAMQYGVNEAGRIGYEKLAEEIKKESPKLIFVGATAYPWILEWEKFSKMAESVGAYLVADISHIAGLIVGGAHPDPVPWVDVITSTTHKTFRGPRGAVIGVTKRGIKKNIDLPKLIDKAVFPGLQGGPHLNTIAAMAVAFEEASQPEFKIYAEQIVKNAKSLKKGLEAGAQGLAPVHIFGTENHLMLVDVGEGRGKEVAEKLEENGIIVNKNTIPNEKGSPFKPSGLRIGTPAMTTRGWKEKEFEELGKRMAKIILV